MKEKRSLSKYNGNRSNPYIYPVDMGEDSSNSCASLADSQWVPFALAMQQSRARLKAMLECTECHPLHLIINGEGGSGKSWLIDHIVKDVNFVFSGSNQQHSPGRVLLLAHQGTAAFNINGQTICSALGFSSFSRSAFSIPGCLTEQYSDSFTAAKHIAHKNVDVETANQKRLLANTTPILQIKSQHHVQQKRLHRQRNIPAGTVHALVSEAEAVNSDRDRVVGTQIKLCVGAPVTLTYNVEQSAGLCNGTNGVVYDFMFASDSELPIVLVQITDTYLGPSFLDDVPNILPVPPKEISWGKRNSDFRVIRRGIPLRLAYAMTVHKVQGLTCEKNIFHCSSVPNVAFAYVALSRVRQRSCILLTQPIGYEKLRATPERRAAFAAEEARVAEKVAQTMAGAVPVVRAMQLIAQNEKQSNLPRR
ncbi:unnamed protein product [Phytophthora fragariaefolia]|uniref:Unnamed protein product n=1 Tax=Phytophthora fragariaefolia TaxID=1490495 RepID=A0A9W6U9X1_9STRA|nr:unnamed protein product [Phytophthora fragariaefolia]